MREPSEGANRAHTVTRRGLLALGGVVGAGALAATIAAESQVTAKPPAPAHRAPVAQSRSFVSTDLTTSAVVTRQSGKTAPGLLFLEPQRGVFNGLIMDDDGEPVWIAPSDLNMTDLRAQVFEGEPVLTYWSGQSVSGHGVGVDTILDTSYRVLAQVQGGGMNADLHEFQLTPQGTALITAYPTIEADLRLVDGPESGYLLNCHIQEVDVRSGRILFDWSAADHIALDESYATVRNPSDGGGDTPATAFDAFHLNSIDYDDSFLYVSSRHTHAVFKIDRATGAIAWRLGGILSDFQIEPAARFAWQHHVRLQPNSMLSMFNNNARSKRSSLESAGLLLSVDEAARTVSLHQKFSRPKTLSIAEGSMQVLSSGNVLVGWGTSPELTEYRANGSPVYEAAALGTASYRAFRFEWDAAPATAPDLAVATSIASRLNVYASWNGSTRVRSWRVLTGADPDSLRAVRVAPRLGFETLIEVPLAQSVAVEALDQHGAVLARSAVVAA